MRDEFGGISVADETDEFGGVAVMDAPRDGFGGIAVEDAPAKMPTLAYPEMAGPAEIIGQRKERDFPREANIGPAPTIPGEVAKGNIGNAGSMAFELLRRPFSGLIGPTEQERSEGMVQFGTNADGTPAYEYMPLGDRLARGQALMTPLVDPPHFAAEPDDSRLTAIGKGAANVTTGLAASFMSPLGAMLPGAAEEPFIARAASGLFAADMLAAVPGQVKQVANAQSPQEAVEGGLGAIAGTLMGVGAGSHALRGHEAATVKLSAPVTLEVPPVTPEVTAAPPRAVPVDLAPKVAAADMPLTAEAIRKEPVAAPEPAVDHLKDALDILNEPPAPAEVAKETAPVEGTVPPPDAPTGEAVAGEVPPVGTSNLSASVEKNIADAKMMSPDDPAGFLRKMADSARAKGNEEAAGNFEEAIKAIEPAEPAMTPEQEAEWRAMQEEHEAETRGSLDEAPGSHELLGAVKSLGGLPSGERDTSLTGETKRLWEASKGRMMRIVNGAQKLSLDGVREGLAQYGFHFDTAAEMLEALEARITTGKEVRGFEPGGGMFASKAEPVFDEKLRSAYDRLVAKDRWKLPAVSIGELAKEAEVPLEKLHDLLRQRHAEGRVVLGVGDFSLSNEVTQRGGMKVPGYDRDVLTVRPLDDTLASKTPPSAEGVMLRRLTEAADKAKTEAEWDATGKQPGQVEIERPSGGKMVVINTKEALVKAADRYRAPSDSSHLQRVADAVEPLKSKVSGVRVRVLRNEADLHERVRSKLKAGDTHEGIVDTDRGDVYLFSDHIRSPERAAEVFAHEVVGHYGVEKLVGPEEWQRIADSVLREVPAASRDIARRYAEGKSLADLTPAERALVAREYVARLAEKPALAPRTWERVVAAVRRALKALGIQKTWSEADIRDLLRRAAREVEAPRESAGTAGILRSVKDLAPGVAELAPKAAEVEAAFEKRVPEDRREDVNRYVADTLAGRKTVELAGDEKRIGDGIVGVFRDMDAKAYAAGVGDQVIAAYRAALTAKPGMTLPERLATFAAETERAKRGAVAGATAPATPAAPAGAESAPAAPQPPESEAPAAGAESRSTSTKNAVMEAERVQRGDPPIVAEARQSHPEAVARAQREMADNPNRADETIDRLRNSDLRTVSVEDEAVLLVEKANLMRERNALTERAADESATPEDQARARVSFAAVESRMATIDEATRASGAIWGRLGALRRRMIRDDFSLEAVERRVRAQKGEPLTLEESAEIKAKVEEVQKSADALEARETALDTEASRTAAADMLAGLEPPARSVSRAVLDLAEKIVRKLENAADAARARIRERMGRASAGVDPTVVYDVAVIGLAKLGRATLDFTKWAAEMRADPDLKDWVEPYLNDAWKQTQELWAKEEAKMSGSQREKVRKARVKRTDILSDRLGIYDGIKAAVKEGATLGEGLDKFVKQLVKNYVDAGERGLDNVTARVKEALEPVIPGVTERQIHDAFSDYGKSTPATSKEADVHRAQIRREAQLTSALADVERGVAPQRTGKQRSPQSAAARQLTARLNEAKRRYNIQPADPAAALRSALDARKTYFRNRMQDLAFEIARKERVIREKSLSPTDAELDSLKAAYELVKADHEAVFGKRELTDEQRLEQAITIAERNEKVAADQLAKAKQGIFEGPRKAVVKPSKELEAIRARSEAMRVETAELKSQSLGLDAAKREAALTKKIEDLNGRLIAGDIEAQASVGTGEPSARAEALKAEYDAMRGLLADLRRDADPRRAPDAVEARKLTKLNKSIDALDAKIQAGDVSAKARRPSSDSAAVEHLKAQRAAMAKHLAEMRRISKQIPMTPEERAIKAYKTRLAREESDLADRHAKADAGDPRAFAKRTRKPIDISQDPQAVAAKARVDKGKEELLEKELAYRLKNRTLGEKLKDRTLEAFTLARAVNLSLDLGFLGLQSAARFLTHPIKSAYRLPEAMSAAWGDTFKGSGWQKLTGTDAALKATKASINLRANARNGVYDAMKIFLGDRNASLNRMEETFRSRLSDRIPGVAHSARAMTAFLDLIRADLADEYVSSFGQGEQLTPKTLRTLGSMVNIVTGRGDFGPAEKFRQALNVPFLAPGWVWSRFQHASGYPLIAAAGRGFFGKDAQQIQAAKIFAKHYMRWAAGMMTLYGAAAFAASLRDGDDFTDHLPDWDPRSSKFGMVKMGEKYYDFSGATLGPMKLVGQAIAGQRLTNKGDVVYLREDHDHKIKFGAQDTGDLLFRYVRGKFGPELGVLWDGLSGRDIMGRPSNWATAFMSRVFPLTPRQMAQIYMEDNADVSEEHLAALLQFIGINSRDETYNAKESMASDPVYTLAEKLGVDPR